jgi:hypothetical protein
MRRPRLRKMPLMRARSIHRPSGVIAKSALIVLTAAAAASVSACQPTDGSGNNDGAIQYCKNQVKDQLLAPSSAKFSNIEASGSGYTLTITGDVDADNAFGAPLREGWTCHSNGTVTLDGS